MTVQPKRFTYRFIATANSVTGFMDAAQEAQHLLAGAGALFTLLADLNASGNHTLQDSGVQAIFEFAGRALCDAASREGAQLDTLASLLQHARGEEVE